jgi:hypothetical protein
VTHLVEHLGHVTLAELRVVDGVDEGRHALDGGVLGAGRHRQERLEHLHPAVLGPLGAPRPGHDVLQGAVLPVVLLLLHGDVVAEQVTERILAAAGNLVLRLPHRLAGEVLRLPGELLDLRVGGVEIAHRLSGA